MSVGALKVANSLLEGEAMTGVVLSAGEELFGEIREVGWDAAANLLTLCQELVAEECSKSPQPAQI